MVGGAKDDMVLRLEGWLRTSKIDLLVKRIFGCEDLLLVRVRKVVEWFLGSFVFSADVLFVRSFRCCTFAYTLYRCFCVRNFQ